MDNLEKSLKEEVKRFNQIGYNSMNLEEQTLGTVGGVLVLCQNKEGPLD